MTTLSRQYSQFTPEERLRLTLAAHQRGDLTEVKRLMGSCPQVTRVVPDPTYTIRLAWMRAAVRDVIINWMDVSALVLYSRLAAESFTAEEGALVAKATARWKESSAVWRGIEAGIRKFCTDADLTWDQVFALAEGQPATIEWSRGLLHDDAGADRRCVQGTCQRLWQAWQGGKEG